LRILKDDSDPRFTEYASLVLSRVGKPKEVFISYLDKMLFLKNWRRIKRKMRKDRWNDARIVFWDEAYSVLSQDVDKKLLKEKGKQLMKLQVFILKFLEMILRNLIFLNL